MIVKPMTKQEEIELVSPFMNDLSLVLNQFKQEVIKRVKNAKNPQEALKAVSILDEPFREEDNE